MSGYDWGKFVQRITIKSDRAVIYKSWATQQGLERWFLRSAVFMNTSDVKRHRGEFIHPSDKYTWMWHGHSDDVTEYGTIQDANGVDTIRFTFADECIVTVKIYLEREETICELTQENIPTDEESKKNYHIGCMTGWNFYMANLKSILEGGIDLRNKNDKIQRIINS